MKPYPNIQDETKIIDWIKEVTRSRADDVSDFSALNNKVSNVLGMAMPTTVQILASLVSVNAFAVVGTLAYTVPAGKTAIITQVVPKVAAASGVTAGPTCSVGTTSTGADIFASTALTALTAVPKIYGFSLTGMSVAIPAGGKVYFNVNSAATGTSETLNVDILGYLV